MNPPLRGGWCGCRALVVGVVEHMQHDELGGWHGQVAGQDLSRCGDVCAPLATSWQSVVWWLPVGAARPGLSYRAGAVMVVVPSIEPPIA